MNYRVLILTTDDCYNFERLSFDHYDVVFLAFWSSPEFVRRLKQAGARTCWPLKELAGHYPTLVKQQYALAQHYVTRVLSWLRGGTHRAQRA